MGHSEDNNAQCVWPQSAGGTCRNLSQKGKQSSALALKATLTPNASTAEDQPALWVSIGPAPITQFPSVQFVPGLTHLPLTGLDMRGTRSICCPSFSDFINYSGHTLSMLNSSKAEKKKKKN